MDMIYGKEKLLPRIKNAEVLGNYLLLLTFDNDERKIFDASELIDLPMYRGLKDVFDQASVSYGTVVWPGGMDVSPDMLYLKSMPEDDMRSYELTEIKEAQVVAEGIHESIK